MVGGRSGVSLVFQVVVVGVLMLTLGLMLIFRTQETANYQETADEVLKQCENIGYSCEYIADCRGKPTISQLKCNGLSSNFPTTSRGVVCCNIV